VIPDSSFLLDPRLCFARKHLDCDVPCLPPPSEPSHQALFLLQGPLSVEWPGFWLFFPDRCFIEGAGTRPGHLLIFHLTVQWGLVYDLFTTLRFHFFFFREAALFMCPVPVHFSLPVEAIFRSVLYLLQVHRPPNPTHPFTS